MWAWQTFFINKIKIIVIHILVYYFGIFYCIAFYFTYLTYILLWNISLSFALTYLFIIIFFELLSFALKYFIVLSFLFYWINLKYLHLHRLFYFDFQKNYFHKPKKVTDTYSNLRDSLDDILKESIILYSLNLFSLPRCVKIRSL